MTHESYGNVPFRAQRSARMVLAEDALYLHGGVGLNGTESILDVSGDLWSFDPVTYSWDRVPRVALWPQPRRCPGFIHRADHLLLWGGSGLTTDSDNRRTYSFLNDLWAFDLRVGTWVLKQAHDTEFSSSCPRPRYYPVFQNGPEVCLLFGGYTEDLLGSQYLGDTWILRGEDWTCLEESNLVPTPAARYGAAATTVNGVTYLFGGFGMEGDRNDVWAFHHGSLRWECISVHNEASAPRARYSCVMGSVGNALVVFGGRSRRYPKLNFEDLWKFDLDTNKWRHVALSSLQEAGSGPTNPGYHAKSAYASDSRWLWLQGGEGPRGHVSDFWRLDMDLEVWEMIHASRSDDPEFW